MLVLITIDHNIEMETFQYVYNTTLVIINYNKVNSTISLKF